MSDFDFIKRFEQEIKVAKVRAYDFCVLNEGETRLRPYLFRHTVSEGDMELGRYVTGQVEIGQEVDEMYARGRLHFAGGFKECGKFQRLDGRWFGTCDLCLKAAHGLYTNNRFAKQRVSKARFVYYVNAVQIDEDIPPFMRVWRLPRTVASFLVNAQKAGKFKFGDQGNDLKITNDVRVMDDTRFTCAILDGADLTGMWGGGIVDVLSTREILHPSFWRYIEGDTPVDIDVERRKKPPILRKRDMTRLVAKYTPGSRWIANHPQNGSMAVTVVGIHETGEVQLKGEDGRVWFARSDAIKEMENEG